MLFTQLTLLRRSLASKQRSCGSQQEVFRLPMDRLLQRGEAVQGPIHAGGSHEKTHWGKASQMHCKFETMSLLFFFKEV